MDTDTQVGQQEKFWLIDEGFFILSLFRNKRVFGMVMKANYALSVINEADYGTLPVDIRNKGKRAK